jgi:hypothetical protein
LLKCDSSKLINILYTVCFAHRPLITSLFTTHTVFSSIPPHLTVAIFLEQKQGRGSPFSLELHVAEKMAKRDASYADGPVLFWWSMNFWTSARGRQIEITQQRFVQWIAEFLIPFAKNSQKSAAIWVFHFTFCKLVVSFTEQTPNEWEWAGNHSKHVQK